MMARVALRNVLRHRLRSAFTVAALAIAVALLADMLMLSGGMEKTFYRVLSSVGYEVRVCPRGTLPFSTDAVIAESTRITQAMDNDARVERWLRVLGTTLYTDSTSLFAMGIDGREQSLYRVVRGNDLDATREGGATPVLLNENAAAALSVELGDPVDMLVEAPGLTRAFRGSERPPAGVAGGAPAAQGGGVTSDRTRRAALRSGLLDDRTRAGSRERGLRHQSGGGSLPPSFQHALRGSYETRPGAPCITGHNSQPTTSNCRRRSTPWRMVRDAS